MSDVRDEPGDRPRVRFEATLFDGTRSAGMPVKVSFTPPQSVQIFDAKFTREHALSAFQVSSRLGNTARYLGLPDGTKLETRDNDAVDCMLRDARTGARHGLLHAFERRWSWVLVSVAVTFAFIVWGTFVGVPWLAERTAYNIPVALEDSIGRQSLATLDAQLLAPTRLPEVDRERVRGLFREVVSGLDLPVRPRLELRRADRLGANAFALPSGIVVITDQMAELANVDGELMAVIAHELGHVHQRHIVRSVLQNAAVALVLAALLGDVTSITGLAASIPTVLVEQGYSRSFELEADQFAARWLDQAGLDRGHLSSALRKLTDIHSGDDESTLGNYLSTHPDTERRIEAIGRRK